MLPFTTQMRNKMLTIRYYEVSDNYSEDGRGINADKVIGNFTTPGVAEEYAKGKGNYGQDARVIPRTLILAEAIEDMKFFDKEQRREQALAKLTPEEIKLLGIQL